MNKFIIAVVSTLSMTVASASLAQDDVVEPEKKKQRHHRQYSQHQQQRGMQAMPVVEMTIRAIRRLDLSPEQKEDVRGIIEGLKADVRPIMMETRANHKELQGLVKAADYEEDKIVALAEKEGNLTTERLLLTSRALSEIYNILTDEQRDELEAMAEQRREKRSKKREPKNGKS